MKASMICIKTEVSELESIPPDSALITLIAFAHHIVPSRTFNRIGVFSYSEMKLLTMSLALSCTLRN